MGYSVLGDWTDAEYASILAAADSEVESVDVRADDPDTADFAG